MRKTSWRDKRLCQQMWQQWSAYSEDGGDNTPNSRYARALTVKQYKLLRESDVGKAACYKRQAISTIQARYAVPSHVASTRVCSLIVMMPDGSWHEKIMMPNSVWRRIVGRRLRTEISY